MKGKDSKIGTIGAKRVTILSWCGRFPIDFDNQTVKENKVMHPKLNYLYVFCISYNDFFRTFSISRTSTVAVMTKGMYCVYAGTAIETLSIANAQELLRACSKPLI